MSKLYCKRVALDTLLEIGGETLSMNRVLILAL
jgi:hypothetical protein